MIIKGYKAFNSDKTNRYGQKFIEGQVYHNNHDLKFGNNGHGFHMCTLLCDVFRYFDSNAVVAKVIGFGNCVNYNDEYNGYYNMYAVSNLYIERFLTREEIINIMLNSSDFEIQKFLRTFTLTVKESELFLQKFENNKQLINFILYYQYGYINIFKENNSKDILKRIKKRTN